MSRFHMTFTAALLAATVAACSGTGRGSRPGSKPSEQSRATLTVDNQTFNDMNIYIVNGGQRIRLGQVVSHQKTEFTIPPTAIGSARELTFLAEPLTRRGGSISNAIWVSPGDRVQLILPP